MRISLRSFAEHSYSVAGRTMPEVLRKYALQIQEVCSQLAK